VMDVENLSFPDAVKKLAAQAGMEVPEDNPSDGKWKEKRKRILELNKEAARFYRSMLDDPRGAQVAEYIRDPYGSNLVPPEYINQLKKERKQAIREEKEREEAEAAEAAEKTEEQ